VCSVFACWGLRIIEVHWPCEFWVVLVWHYCAFREGLFTNNGVLSPISKHSPRGFGKKHCWLLIGWWLLHKGPFSITQRPHLSVSTHYGRNGLFCFSVFLPYYPSQLIMLTKVEGCQWHLSHKLLESMVKVFLSKFSYLSQSVVAKWNLVLESRMLKSWLLAKLRWLNVFRPAIYQANENCPWRGGSLPLLWALAFTVQRWMMVKQSPSLTSTGIGKVWLLLQAAGGHLSAAFLNNWFITFIYIYIYYLDV